MVFERNGFLDQSLHLLPVVASFVTTCPLLLASKSLAVTLIYVVYICDPYEYPGH